MDLTNHYVSNSLASGTKFSVLDLEVRSTCVQAPDSKEVSRCIGAPPVCTSIPDRNELLDSAPGLDSSEEYLTHRFLRTVPQAVAEQPVGNDNNIP
jgi:hypothetical protein